MISYKDNDPKGWCGDMTRGAALGRTTKRGDILYNGKMHLRRVRLDNGGYDCNGTYFGHGEPLFWYAADSENPDDVIDGMIRAKTREAAKEKVLEEYPDVKFYR